MDLCQGFTWDCGERWRLVLLLPSLQTLSWWREEHGDSSSFISDSCVTGEHFQLSPKWHEMQSADCCVSDPPQHCPPDDCDMPLYQPWFSQSAHLTCCATVLATRKYYYQPCPHCWKDVADADAHHQHLVRLPSMTESWTFCLTSEVAFSVFYSRLPPHLHYIWNHVRNAKFALRPYPQEWKRGWKRFAISTVSSTAYLMEMRYAVRPEAFHIETFMCGRPSGLKWHLKYHMGKEQHVITLSSADLPDE